MQVKSTDDDKPVRSVTSEDFDFRHDAPLQQSYCVASSYRCGSVYLCSRLWQTGLLGAPMEVLNPMGVMRVLTNRLKTSSRSDYIAKLLALRTSRNGVFGMKAHFHHFEAFLKEYPALLEVLSPITFIYISRQDKIAQAVSMAKALQTGQWTSRMEAGPGARLQYDFATIANCLNDIARQDQDWRGWFEAHGVTPHQVTYDDLTADPDGVVRDIVGLLGVQNDESDVVNVPPVNKQGDETNEEWIERFERELKERGGRLEDDNAGAGNRRHAADAGSEPSATPSGHFFDRQSPLIKNLSGKTRTATGFIDAIRLRHRYDAIVAQNDALFRDARVLDLACSKGFWSLAALDRGAARVVGVERSRKLVEAGAKSFADNGINPESYQFIRSGIFAALESFEPEAFDVILCKGFFEQSDFVLLFEQLSRLRPKHVILDTKIVGGLGPLARFAIASKAKTRKTRKGGKERKLRKGKIVSLPNHDLIEFLCESEFQWRLVDWQALGIADWTGVQDYARDTRRTYVLDRAS